MKQHKGMKMRIDSSAFYSIPTGVRSSDTNNNGCGLIAVLPSVATVTIVGLNRKFIDAIIQQMVRSMSKNKIINEIIDQSVHFIIFDSTKFEHQIVLLECRLKLVSDITFSFDKYHNFNHVYTFTTCRKRSKMIINQIKRYKNIIARSSSIIKNITDIYSYRYQIIDLLIVCYVFHVYIIYLHIIKLYKNYFLLGIKLFSIGHTIYTYNFILIGPEATCNAFNFCLLLIVEMMQTRISSIQTAALIKKIIQRVVCFRCHKVIRLVSIIGTLVKTARTAQHCHFSVCCFLFCTTAQTPQTTMNKMINLFFCNDLNICFFDFMMNQYMLIYVFDVLLHLK